MLNLQDEYRKRIPLYKALSNNIEKSFIEILEGKAKIDRISFRIKEPASFERKAYEPPSYSDPITEIEDQVGGRVIVVYKSDVKIISDLITRNFNAVESTNKRPAKDAEFGYESTHLILSIPPHLKPRGWSDLGDVPVTFEAQIRTIFMHAWAEPSHGLDYKSASELPRDLLRELSWIAASAWGADQALDRIRRGLKSDRKP